MRTNFYPERTANPVAVYPQTKAPSLSWLYPVVGLLILGSVAFPEFQLRYSGIPLDLFDLAWAGVFLALIAITSKSTGEAAPLPFRKLYWFFLLLHFPGGLIMSALSDTPVKSLYWLFRYLSAASPYFILVTLTHDKNHLRQWATFIMLGVLFQSVFGTGQAMLPESPAVLLVRRIAAFSREAFAYSVTEVGGVVTSAYIQGTVVTAVRVSGTMWNAIGFAELVELGFALSAGILLSFGERRQKLLTYATFPFFILAILFSGSRISYLALGASGLYLLVRTRNFKMLVPLTVGFVVVSIFSQIYYDTRLLDLQSPDEIAEEFNRRFGFDRWENMLTDYVFQQPFLAVIGSGFGANQTGKSELDDSVNAAYLHNVYARVFAKMGLFGSLAFFILLARIWLWLNRAYAHVKRYQRTAVLFAGMTIIIFLIFSVSEHYMITVVGGWRYIWILLGTIVSMFVVLETKGDEDGANDSAPAPQPALARLRP